MSVSPSSTISPPTAGRCAPAPGPRCSATTAATSPTPTPLRRYAIHCQLPPRVVRRPHMTVTESRYDGDTWDLASSVGATATAVAASRAMASQGPDALLDDRFAESAGARRGHRPLRQARRRRHRHRGRSAAESPRDERAHHRAHPVLRRLLHAQQRLPESVKRSSLRRASTRGPTGWTGPPAPPSSRSTSPT